MADFFELISNFENIRDYMRDFYIYGFKTREDFSQKSLRTYDNEKRRIESYLGQYMHWDYSGEGKRTFLSIDSSYLSTNPFYSAWKAKRFGCNDVILHFMILDTLQTHSPQTITQITDHVAELSGEIFELQTVRNKCNSYVSLGLLTAQKIGRSLEYSLGVNQLDHLLTHTEHLLEAISFFQGAAPLGVIGSFLLDKERKQNTHYCYRHQYLVHTLEDDVLLQLTKAMTEHRLVTFENFSRRSEHTQRAIGYPLKILVNTQSGRRYLCLQNTNERYLSYRLDCIRNIKLLDEFDGYKRAEYNFEHYYKKVWGASLSSFHKPHTVCLKLFIHEKKEKFVLERLKREGRGGQISHVDENIYLYTIEVHDANEISTWIKTFVGRIISLESSDTFLRNRFYSDMKKMQNLYCKEEDDDLI